MKRCPVCNIALIRNRIIMEKLIGRKLYKSEIVHHINGNKLDNRPTNLHITSRKKHEHCTYIKCLQKRIRELEGNPSEDKSI